MKEDFDENKRPGKTAYSGRRRPTTRRSGFKAHPETSGGEFKTIAIAPRLIKAGETMALSIHLPTHQAGEFVGFGGWFSSDQPIKVEVQGVGLGRLMLKQHLYPNWGKVGSMWICKAPRRAPGGMGLA